MTLIPLISAMLTAPEAATAAAATPSSAGAATFLPRNAYGSEGGRHPVAALFAVGLPAALVVAVALSPMIMVTPPKSDPMTGTIIELDKPMPPPPDPAKDAAPTPKSAATTEAVKPLVPTPPLAGDPVQAGPSIPDAYPYDPGPPVQAADPPAPPKLVFADLDPRYAGGFQPDYPAREQRGGIEGTARVRVLIGIDGRVKAVEQVSADSPGFFEETRRRALSKWRFKPATRGGVPEESWKVMTVRFEIKNA